MTNAVHTEYFEQNLDVYRKQRQQERQEREARKRRQQLRLRRRLIAFGMCVVLLIMSFVAGTGAADKGNDIAEGAQTPIGVNTTPEEVHVAISPETSTSNALNIAMTTEYEYPFNTMSKDWGGPEMEGFVYHDISREAKASGGYFPEIMQIYTFSICKNYGVDYEMVFALIEIESHCRYDAEGDDGRSVGYMQIQERWHRERMERLGVTDLKNPFQNVLVGVDILAEIQRNLASSGTDTLQADVLAAYNYGMSGAKKCLWNNGIHFYSYNTAILQRADQLKKEIPAWEVSEE